MKLESVAAIGINLSRSTNGFQAGEAACHGAADAFGADAVVLWLPAEAGLCRAEDLFVAGQAVSRSSILEIAHAVRSGSLELWLDARGAPAVTVRPVFGPGGRTGLLAVAWRAAPADGPSIDAFVEMIAGQVQAVLFRSELADRVSVELSSDVAERREADQARRAAVEDLRSANERTRVLLTEQMRLSQRGSAILDLTRRLIAETDAEAVYHAVLECAERQLDGSRALILNCDPAGPTFATRTPGPRARTLRRTLGLHEPAPAAFGADVVTGLAATSVLLDPRFGFDSALVEDGMRAATVVSVAVGGRPQPALLLAWPDARQCPPEDLWFVENLGVQLGLALKNTRLYSDLRQSLLSLRAAQEEVARTQRVRALGDFASGMAHQINNSLTSILGLADWLLFTGPNGNRPELETIRAAAAGIADLVKRLQGFGRSSTAAEACELVDPVESLRRVPDLIRPLLDDEYNRRGVRHDVVMELNDVPLTRFVRSELREVLLHLVSNAIESMPHGGRLTLRSREADGWVRLSVADEGEGIAPDIRPRLFSPFVTTKGPEHIGLGLSVCRGIAERHGASIEIESEAAGGVTATLVLPVPEAVRPSAGQAPRPAGRDVVRAPEGPRRLRVLLVDDHRDVRETVSEMVAALGHQVETAQEGAAALTMMASGAYDILLTDLGMPGMDGRELARRAVASQPGLRVVLLTGWCTDAEGLGSPGVSDVLLKPLTMNALRAAIEAGVGA